MPGHVVAARFDGPLVVLDARDGHQIRRLAPMAGSKVAVDPVRGTVWFTPEEKACGPMDMFATDVEGGDPVRVTDGRLPELSPDLGRLALVRSRGRAHPIGGECRREVVVRDLATGDERSWAVPRYELVEVLAWVDEGQLLVATSLEGDDSGALGTVVLDTTEGDSLEDARSSGIVQPAAELLGGLGQSGQMAAVLDERAARFADREVVDTVPVRSSPDERLAAVDPVTGEEVRTLYRFPEQRDDADDFLARPGRNDRHFASDRSGRHLLWSASDTLFRFSAGDEAPTPLSRGVASAAWAER